MSGGLRPAGARPPQRRTRVVIYARAGSGADTQREQCARHVAAAGYELVALAADPPGRWAGLLDALGLVAAGRADLVVVAPAVGLPVKLAGAGGLMRRPRPGVVPAPRRPAEAQTAAATGGTGRALIAARHSRSATCV